jgi:hypothetical protein
MKPKFVVVAAVILVTAVLAALHVLPQIGQFSLTDFAWGLSAGFAIGGFVWWLAER